MKQSLALVLAVICIAGVHSHKLSEEQMKKIHADVEGCINESGVSRDLLDDIKANKKFTPTRELNCFSACMLKHNGVMNQDGSLNNKPTDSDAVKECKKLVGADECETAGKVMECYHKNHLIPKIEH